MKKKPTRKHLSNHEVRQLFTGLPKFRHVGEGIPGELTSAWDKSYRSLVIGQRLFSRVQWELLRNSDVVTEERATLMLRLMAEIYAGVDLRVAKYFAPPWQSRVVRGGGLTMPVQWTKIESVEVDRKILYTLGDRHTVEIKGERYQIGYSTHALIQALERLCDTSENRFLLGQVMRANHVDPSPDGKGFFLWSDARSSAYARTVFQAIHGDDASLDLAQVRIGFCPVTIRGKFAAADTMLTTAMARNGFNAALCSPVHVIARNPRAIEEILRLNEVMPLTRTVQRSVSQSDKNPVYLAAVKKLRPELHAFITHGDES